MQDATAADDTRPLRRSANLAAVGRPPRSPHLRPYQVEAQQAIVEHRRRGIRTQLVSLATGLGKCVDPQTWVWSHGLRRFGDAWGSGRIAGPHRTDEVAAWYDDGVNPGKRIETAAGLTIDGTLAHRVWIRRDDGFEGWSALEDVRLGDFVAVARGRADFGLTELDPVQAFALGRAAAGNPIGKAAPVLDREPMLAGAGVRSRGGRAGGAPEIGWTELAERAVAHEILSGTRTTIAAYLRGYLWTGDGSRPAAERTTSSPTLAEQVQQLLVALGVFAGRRTRLSPDGPTPSSSRRCRSCSRCGLVTSPSSSRIATN
jgi:hypothetical protein